MTPRLLGQSCKCSPLSRNSRWFIEFLLKPRPLQHVLFIIQHSRNPTGCTSSAIMLHASVERSLIYQTSYWTVFRDILSSLSAKRKKRVNLGPIHTYPDIFDSPTFSFRIRLPSTSMRWIRHTNPQPFESALQSGNFLMRYESEIVWTLNLDT